MEFPGKYTTKLLYGWDDKKFEEEYLRKLERNWRRQKNDQKEYKENKLEWDERDEKTDKVIWGEDTEVSPEKKP